MFIVNSWAEFDDEQHKLDELDELDGAFRSLWFSSVINQWIMILHVIKFRAKPTTDWKQWYQIIIHLITNFKHTISKSVRYFCVKRGVYLENCNFRINKCGLDYFLGPMKRIFYAFEIVMNYIMYALFNYYIEKAA